MLEQINIFDLPYKISISTQNDKNNYLSHKIVDMQFESVHKLIRLIKQTQLTYKNKIRFAITNGINDMHSYIKKYQSRISDLEVMITDLPPESIILLNSSDK